MVVVIGMTACSQAERVSENLSKEADNFNVIRRLTVINCIQGDVLFSMEGKMSLTADSEKQKIDIIVEDENGDYQKHMVGLSDNVTYTINYNPNMWIPFDVKTID